MNFTDRNVIRRAEIISDAIDYLLAGDPGEIHKVRDIAESITCATDSLHRNVADINLELRNRSTGYRLQTLNNNHHWQLVKR